MKLMRRYEPRDVLSAWDDFFSTANAERSMSPAVDVVEEKDKYVIKADLPGIKQDDVKVELEEGVLRISGERKSEHEERNEEKKYHYIERSWGSFERRFTLPRDTDADKIDAKYENGVLKIIVPKTEAKKPKEIKVK